MDVRTSEVTNKWLVDHPRWTPPYASWLDQIELFFSALARRVLRHIDFSNPAS
ncbi:hypothetical protein [Streptomyces sp. NPDC002104]